MIAKRKVQGSVKTDTLRDLYEKDETAWLEIMAGLVAQKNYAALDTEHLSEYLTDMAIRDRREVKSRLVQLMLHLLKWEHQPENRTGSWEMSIDQQRLELRLLLESRTLLNHSNAVLENAYQMARRAAARQTKLKLLKFPKECPWTIDQLLADE